MKKVFIGADHKGFLLKTGLIHHFQPLCRMKDCGSYSDQATDYPDIAHKVCSQVIGEKDFGVLICGTGIGMSITSNRYPHIRGALVRTPQEASLARQHNDANILILGANAFPLSTAIECLDIFLTTSFEGGRHQRRLNKINDRKD